MPFGVLRVFVSVTEIRFKMRLLNLVRHIGRKRLRGFCCSDTGVRQPAVRPEDSQTGRDKQRKTPS